jgi:hypothetical protein
VTASRPVLGGLSHARCLFDLGLNGVVALSAPLLQRYRYGLICSDGDVKIFRASAYGAACACDWSLVSTVRWSPSLRKPGLPQVLCPIG